jgi:arylsulfatase A-like enzyme
VSQRIALFLLLVFLVAPLHGQGATSPAAPGRPNIVYILADDMGYADVEFMGCKDIHTPNLTGMAKDAAVLESFYVQPVCSPTRSCLMTGRYVAHTGVYEIVKPRAKWGLPLPERTLATAMREAGYETAIVGKWHLGEFEQAYQPMHRGFDHQYGNWFGMIDYFTHKRGAIPDWHRDDQPCDDKGYSTQLDATEACRLIKAKADGKPLFLYVPFNAVHTPLQAPASYIEPYKKLQGERRPYAGMVAAMDDAIGQIVAALKEKGILDNTLILFSSDNGGPAPGRLTDNTPLRAGKGTIYEGGVRVCAFALWPGHIPAGHIKEPLHMVDWYPTLVHLVGGSLDQKLPLDGKDIWPVLTQGAKSPHESILLCGTVPKRVAIRMGDWKLLLNPNEKDAGEAKEADAATGKVELYNVVNDISEKNDLAAANPEKVKELRLKLGEYMKGFVPPGNASLGEGPEPELPNKTGLARSGASDADPFLNDD